MAFSRFSIRKFDSSGIDCVVSFSYVNVIHRHGRDLPVFASTPSASHGSPRPKICLRTLAKLFMIAMHWHNSGSVRRPPGFIEPCLPTNGHSVPTGPRWAYEIKHDGFRFICRRELDRVRVFSRRGHDWTDRVPRIAEALTALKAYSVTLRRRGPVVRLICSEQRSVGRDRVRQSCTRSICSSSMAATCAPPVLASSYLNTLKTRTVPRSIRRMKVALRRQPSSAQSGPQTTTPTITATHKWSGRQDRLPVPASILTSEELAVRAAFVAAGITTPWSADNVLPPVPSLSVVRKYPRFLAIIVLLALICAGIVFLGFVVSAAASMNSRGAPNLTA